MIQTLLLTLMLCTGFDRIVATRCYDGYVYNVWSNGTQRYWLPKLDKHGNQIPCSNNIKKGVVYESILKNVWKAQGHSSH